MISVPEQGSGYFLTLPIKSKDTYVIGLSRVGQC